MDSQMSIVSEGSQLSGNGTSKNIPEGLLKLVKEAEQFTVRLIKAQKRLREDTVKPGQEANLQNQVLDPKALLAKQAEDKQDGGSMANDFIRTAYVEQPNILRFGKLQTHQIDSLKWMVSLYENNINGILADDMGLGKTIQAISMLCYLWESQHVRQPHLVIAPKSTIPNWLKEFKRWSPHFRVVHLIPTLEHRKDIIENQMQPGQFDIVVTTYEAVLIVLNDLRKHDWSYVIFDEAHKLKNSESQTSKQSALIPSRRRLLLTGTPLQNNLGELWSLLHFLMPQLFGSKESFETWFDFNSADEGDKSLLVQTLHKILRPFILRRTKKDLETKLPDKIEMNVQLGMSELQMKIYKQLLEAKTNFFGGTGTVMLKGYHNILMQLRKVCNHPYMFDDIEEEGDEFGEHLIQTSGKMIFLDKLLKKVHAQKEQVVIFSCFTSMLDIIEDYAIMRQFKYCRLDGQTDLKDREEQIEDFSSPNTNKTIFLISTRAGGLGINLVTANHVVLFDSDFNPQVDSQAIDRVYRIGQKKKVYAYRLVTESSVEEKIVQRQAIKLKLDQLVIQQGRSVQNQKKLNKDEYEKILLHGAAQIIQQKRQMMSFDIDIEQMIEKAETTAKELAEQAEKQAEEINNAFDLTLDSIDCFKFQDKDFREERKNVQNILDSIKPAEKTGDGNASNLQLRPRRAAAMAAAENLNNKDRFHEEMAAKRKETQDQQRERARLNKSLQEADEAPLAKDKSITVPQIYDFQFYDDIDQVQELALKIKKLIDDFKVVPDELKVKFQTMLGTGFPEWTLRDYQTFIKAFKKRSIEDVEGIASEVESKSTEQVQQYLVVFLHRFRELKERDLVLLKFQQKDFDQKNLQTIMEFDITKNYTLFLQTNHYFNRRSYLALIQKAHERMQEQNRPNSTDLQLKLDHFFHAQPKKMFQEQLKYVATAIRIEDRLKDHLHFLNDRKDMKAAIEKSRQFTAGFEGIAQQETQLITEQFEDEKSKQRVVKPRLREVSDNLKYGLNKGSTAKLFQKQNP